MIWFLGLELLPVGYCILYLRHSIRQKRYAQTAAVAALILPMLTALALLLWEFFALP
jgi:hypothetical protein